MDRKPGRSKEEKKDGQKWIEANYDAKEKARAKHNGELPFTPALETSDHPLSRDWSAVNLPDILFYLTPPLSEFEGKSVHYLIDGETGEVALSEEGNKIRDLEILPRYISIEVEGWMIEAWRRTDPRITYQDILDRQRTDPEFGDGIGLKKLTKNAMQNHCRRDCRKLLGNWVEYGRRDEPHRTEVETIEELSYHNIALNTVLDESSDFPGRLVKLALKRQARDGLYHAEELLVTPSNVRQTTIDKQYFLRAKIPGISADNDLTASMDAAWQMYLLLMERARKHGKQHWSKLGKQCLPVTWFDRLAKGKRTIPNSTYDGGCDICTWFEGCEKASTPIDNEPSAFITPIKRARLISVSTSDEPLLKKRKRARARKSKPISDFTSKDEVAVDDKAPPRDRVLTPERSVFCTTPIQPERPSRAGYKDVYDYDTEMEDGDNDAIQAVLSSGGITELISVCNPDTNYQNSDLRLAVFESPLAPYSVSLRKNDHVMSPLAAFKDAATTHVQPHWEEIEKTKSDTGGFLKSPYQPSNQNFGLVDYQGLSDPGQISFTSNSTYLDHSSSSSKLDTETAETLFAAGYDMHNVPYSVQAANVKMQHMLAHERMSTHRSYQPPHHVGRQTVQGVRLTKSMSSPAMRRTNDFDVASYTYQPNNHMFAIDFSRRHSFEGYLSQPSYSLEDATDVNWRSADLEFDDQSTLQDAKEVIKDDYNLPPASHLPTQPESENTGFLALLSSDPIMPEDYEDMIDPRMIDESTSKYDDLRIFRQTPPLLDC